MIRPATPHDLPVLADMAGPVMAALQPAYPFHRGQALATLRNRIDSETGLVLLLEDETGIFGGMTAMICPSPWTLGLQAVCDLRWVDPARRGRWGHVLIRRFEAWAADRGAHVLGVSQTGRDAEGYYRRLGYHPAEMMFWKAI